MSAIKYLLILVLIASATGYLHRESHESSRLDRRTLLDPWRHIRDSCRKALDLSEKELKDLDRNGGNIEPYATCFAQQDGFFNKDGTLNKVASVESVKDVVPRTLAEPLMNYCLEAVYHGKPPHPDRVYRAWTEFVYCIKKKLTPEMWNLLGGFAAPEYPPLGLVYKKNTLGDGSIEIIPSQSFEIIPSQRFGITYRG